MKWTFDFTPKAERALQKQVALQAWEAGKVVREVFYHG